MLRWRGGAVHVIQVKVIVLERRVFSAGRDTQIDVWVLLRDPGDTSSSRLPESGSVPE